MRARNEAITDGLVESARRERAPRRAHALLRGRQHGARDGVRARHRLRGDFADTVNTYHLLDQIGRAFDIAAPGGRRYLELMIALDRETQRKQNAADHSVGELNAGEAVHVLRREDNLYAAMGSGAGDDGFRRFA